MTKICTGPCGIDRPLEDFYPQKGGKFGVCSLCKNCYSDYNKRRWSENTRYRQRAIERNREWKKNNIDKVRAYSHHSRRWAIENPELVAAYKRKYKKTDKGKEAERRYRKTRLESDINYRIAHHLGCRLSKAIRRDQRAGSAIRDLGCSISEFKAYIETLFREGMSWENYGEWQIDHILPLSKFDLMDRNQFLKACYYTNLQPLWAEDNRRKSNRVDSDATI